MKHVKIVVVIMMVSFYAILPAHAQSTQVFTALNYLATSQKSDGTWDSSTAQVETTATTVAVVETLKLLNQNYSTPFRDGSSWLQTQTPQSVAYIADRIRVLNLTDGSLNSLLPALGQKGAWGGYNGYETNILDTVLALQALKTANYSDLTVINNALGYLTGSQNADGGWGFVRGNESNVYMTAVVSSTLQQFPQMSPIATAVGKASSYLLAHQNADGGFGDSPSSVYETALAYIALVGDGRTQGSPLQNAVNFLSSAQSANGSWNDDPYSTALALKALYFSENIPSPPPPPPAAGRISGTVVDATTRQGVSGVAVVLQGNNLICTTTDSTGAFSLPDVPPGAQTVSFSLSGYLSTTASATAVVDTTVSVGTVSMLSSYTTGTIAGTILDANGKPLSDVAVAVSGAWSGSTVTGADGTFAFSYVKPGQVTVTAAKAGYHSFSSTGTVYARITLSVFPRLSTAAPTGTTGSVVGRVVSEWSGLPILHLPDEEGVKITFSGGTAVEPDDNGYFSAQGLAPNTYQVTVGMLGFINQTFRLVVAPGVTSDLGTIRLVWSASTITLVGKVTDAATGAAIPDAEVVVIDPGLTGRSDFAGNYVITFGDIDLGDFTVKASAPGYVGKTYLVSQPEKGRAAVWTQQMDITLAPQVTTGSLTGTVVDAVTNQPLPGVNLSLVSAPSVTATTDSSGVFTFSSIREGAQQITLSLSGYAQRILTTAVFPGAAGNVGTIPLSVQPVPASIQGAVWDGVANTPFAGVDVQASGAGSWQSVTSADGTYRLPDVTPGTVTVAATAGSRPGYYGARFTGELAPGGLLVFSPILTTIPPANVSVALQADREVYKADEPVAIRGSLQNRLSSELTTGSLLLRVTGPEGASVYLSSAALDLPADGAAARDFSFAIPPAAQGGNYTVRAELYDAAGIMAGTGSVSIGVSVSRITVTPALPASFSAGANTVTFHLANNGELPVTAGLFGVTMRDPDGEVVASSSQTFALGLGENKTLTFTVPIGAVKFGSYTLSYSQGDETKAAYPIDIAVPNSIAIAPVLDKNSYRVRETVTLTVMVTNTGRFDLAAGGSGLAVTAAVPDAGYAETKTFTTAPAVGSASGSALLYRIAIPETLSAGQHGIKIAVALPSGSTREHVAQLAIPESALSLTPVPTACPAGGTVSPAIANSGGVDTAVLYTLSLYDVKSARIAQKSGTETALAGSSLDLALPIPDGAVDGAYNLVVQFKDLKTGKEEILSNPVTISGMNGALQVRTNKPSLLLSESIESLSGVTSSGAIPIANGNLHLEVVTEAASLQQKSWTSQSDFQQGVRNGVDTYGVNDGLIPDDDFEAGSFDQEKWAVIGDVSIQSGKALVNSSSVESSLIGKLQFEGDFDVEVDFSSNSSVYNQGAELGVQTTAGGWVFIKNNWSEAYFSGIWLGNSNVSNRRAGSYSSSGKFRIVRTGNTIYTTYWSGSSWVEVNRGTYSEFAGLASFRLWIWRGAGYSGTTARFDNFKINSGRIKTITQTVDAIRLLPLQDNFDDGVTNSDRWIYASYKETGEVAGNGKVTEVNGKRIIEITNASPHETAETKGNFMLEGDFDVRVNWSDFTTTIGGDGTGVELGIGADGDNYSYIRRALVGSAHQYLRGVQVNGAWSDSASSNTSDVSGKLRITRTGTALRTFYGNGAVWTELGSQASFGSQPVWMTLRLWMGGSGNAAAKLDNFEVLARKFAPAGTVRLRSDAGRLSNWKNLAWNATQPAGTSVKLRTRSANTEADLAGATWSEYLTTSGSAITSPRGRWLEVEAALSTTDSKLTPLLHDVTVSYGNSPGDALWEADLPVNLAQGATADLSAVIGTLGTPGKYYLQGTLTSSSGQTVASSEYPFYVEQGNTELHLVTDKKIYRPGETVTVSGEVRNLAAIDAAGLVLKIQGTSNSGTGTLYSETINVLANGSHPFSFTTIAGSDGSYGLSGTVTQNAVTLASVADQYHSSSPAIAASVSAPDTAGSGPFTVSMTLNNAGQVDGTVSVRVTDDSGAVLDDQQLTVSAGESRVLQYTRQIAGTTTYTAAFSGDLNQTITRTVQFVAAASTAASVSVGAQVVVDRVYYAPNQQATVTATMTNLSASSMAENLTAWTAIVNSQGEAVYSESTALASLVPGQTASLKRYWNTGSNPAGTYLVAHEVRDASGRCLARATCDLSIGRSLKPTALLKGVISLDKQSILTGEPIAVSYSVTNAGNVDLAEVAISVKAIDVNDTMHDAVAGGLATLAMGAKYTGSGVIDTNAYGAKDYLVVLRASIAGVEETLAGSYFRVEGAPSAPALNGPASGVDVESFAPILKVSNASDANEDQLSYHFELYADSGMTSLVSTGTVPEAADVTAWTVAASLTENQSYYWRARAYDGKLYGSWMTPASFRVNTVNDPPSAPAISSPSDGTDVALFAPRLVIGNSADPDSGNLTYNFEIANDESFTDMVASAKGITSGEGSTSWAVPVNLQENAWYYWRAQADDWLVEGQWSTVARFLVNSANDAPSAPVVVAPANGSSVAAMEAGIAAANAEDPDSPSLTYYFELDTDPSFDSPNLLRSGAIAQGEGSTLWQAGGLTDNTRYSIRVKASDGSAESHWSTVTSFFVNTANDAPTTPVLANPSNGAGVTSLTPTLSVHNASDLDQETPSYEFELYSDAALTTRVAHVENVAETGQTTRWQVPAALSENGTYYWRARAYDGSLHSGWMPMASFMVNTANDSPGVPGVSAPAAGSTVTTLTPILALANASDPDSDSLTYHFEIYQGDLLVAASSGVPEGGSGVTAWSPEALLADNTLYQWRARAFDGDSYGPWTAMSSFTVHIPQTSVTATIDFDPDTLNKSSNGTWVVVYIEFPAGYQPADADISSIRIEGSIAAESRPYGIGDHDKDGIADLMVKFKRSELVNLLSAGDRVPVQVTGKIGNMLFEGVDVIRVIK